MMAKQETVDKNSREYLERQVNSGRGVLLGLLIFTVINLVLLLLEADRYFPFGASVPYFLTLLGVAFDSWGGSGYTATALVVSGVVLAVYLVMWILSKKRSGWLTAAAVMFVVDTVALIWFSFTLLENPLSNVKDLIFHAFILWELFRSAKAGKKLRELPDDVAPQGPITGAELRGPITGEEYRDAMTKVKYRGTTPDLD